MAKKRKKLDIKCTKSECAAGLHCFIPNKKMLAENKEGLCRSCDASIIDWPQLHERSLSSVSFTFESMRKEWVRNYFWTVRLNERVLNHARRKGKGGLRLAVHRNLESTIGAAKPFRDGAQTEMPDPDDAVSIYPYARHATGTCCRKCAKLWHGIPKGQPLSAEELTYLTELVCRYIEERVPGLTEEGENISTVRT